MAQNVNPASSSSSGYEKDAMERNSATSSSQVRIQGKPEKVVRKILILAVDFTKHGLAKSN